MLISASAGRSGRRDLRDHCEGLSFKNATPDEAKWLALLYRVIIFGGSLTMHRTGEDPVTVEFGDIGR